MDHGVLKISRNCCLDNHTDHYQRNNSLPPSSGLCIAIALTSIFVLSLWIRTSYLNALIENDPALTFAHVPDSSGYIQLAQNIVHHHRYAQNSMESRHLALLRTPGYPVFYALFEYFEMAPKYVLWAHVLIGALIPVVMSILVYCMTGSVWVTALTGLLNSLSASGILMIGEIHVDLLLSFTFMCGFLCVYITLLKNNNYMLYFSGVLFGLSALIKPTMFLWPVVSIIIYYFFSKALKQSIAYKKIAVLFLIQAAIIGGWCQRNYIKENVFTLSSIGVETLRIYLTAEVDVSIKNKGEPITAAETRDYQRKIREKIKNDLQQNIPIKEINQRLQKESLTIIKQHPVMTYRWFAINILDNFKGPIYWPLYTKNLSSNTLLYKFCLVLILSELYFMKIVFPLLFLFLVIMLIMLKKNPDRISIKSRYILFSLIFILLYFSVLSGFTFWTGPRIVYPSYLALMCIIPVAIKALLDGAGQKNNPA